MAAENLYMSRISDMGGSDPEVPGGSTDGRRLGPEARVLPGPEPAKRKTPKIPRSSLVLAAMFGTGLAGVGLLSMRGGPATASAQQIKAEKQVDAALAKMGKGAPAGSPQKAASLLEAFYADAKQRQIPLNMLGANPFRFEFLGATTLTPQAELPKDQIAEAPSDNTTEAIAALRTLRLQSVLTGSSGNVAVVSNNLLTEGQVIAGWTVQTITPEEVVLTFRDQRYVLTMPRK